MPGDSDGYSKRKRTLQRGKVIDLQGHHAAEQAINALLQTDAHDPNYEKLIAEAVALGSPILAAVVRHLDSSRPQRYPALGRLVLAYPFRIQAVQTLLRAAADRRNSDNRRMGVIILLGQFLGVPPAEDFLSSLRNPALTATNSLLGALNNHADEPDLLFGYFRTLSALPPDALYSMLNILADVPGRPAVSALRLLALQPDPELMHGAVQALTSRTDPISIEALGVLEPNLPPEVAHTAARYLQKLRLSGMSTNPLDKADGRCRALLSPIDGAGNRLLGLVVPTSPESREQTFLGLLLRDSVGLAAAVGTAGYYAPDLPKPAPIGTLHPPLADMAPDSAVELAAAPCLEAPFGYGLNCLREAVEKNWLTGTPLPFEYQVFFDRVWRFGGRARNEEIDTGKLVDESRFAAENESELLSNPVFDSWYLESGAVYLAAQELLAQSIGLPEEMTDESWRALLPMVIRLAHTEFSMHVRQTYSERLDLMAEWLLIAGQEHDATLAVSAARTILESPPETNLFALALVQKGILVAFNNLASGSRFEL